MPETENMNADSHVSATTTVNKKSLGQQVYELLENWIIEGKLAPGTRLTAEAIAKEVGVSRSPVREAIFELQRVGLAERMGFHDFRVFVPNERFVLDLFDLYVILEVGQLYFASLKATPSDIERIGDLINEMGQPHIDKKKYAVLSQQLSLIYKIGYDNILLKNLMVRNEKYLKWLEHAYYEHEAKSSSESHAEHVIIFEKFRQRDLAGLIGALQLHMYKHRSRVLKLLMRDTTGRAHKPKANVEASAKTRLKRRRINLA